MLLAGGAAKTPWLLMLACDGTLSNSWRLGAPAGHEHEQVRHGSMAGDVQEQGHGAQGQRVVGHEPAWLCRHQLHACIIRLHLRGVTRFRDVR